MNKSFKLAVVACLGLMTAPVSAATFSYSGTFAKHECFGQGGFDACTFGGSPTVAKFKYKKGVHVRTRLNNTVFPSIDGSEFAISLTTKKKGTWSYDPSAGDPLNITAFVVKAGKKYAVYTWDVDSGNDFSDILWNVRKVDKKRMKHLTFFDTGTDVARDGQLSPVPIPAAGLLLIAGLGGLVGLRRRRKS